VEKLTKLEMDLLDSKEDTYQRIIDIQRLLPSILARMDRLEANQKTKPHYLIRSLSSPSPLRKQDSEISMQIETVQKHHNGECKQEKKEQIDMATENLEFSPNKLIAEITEKRNDCEKIDKELISKDTGYVLNVYGPVVHEIYEFYCRIYWGYFKGKISLNKTQFLKFYRDCCLPNVLKESSYELIWTKILRSCDLAKSNHSSETNGKELMEDQFANALIVIANELYKKSSLTEAAKLETFIVSHVLPNVTPLLQAAKEQSTAVQTLKQDICMANTYATTEYNEEEKKKIEKLFKKYKKDLYCLFKKFCMGKKKGIGTTISLKGNPAIHYTPESGMTLKGLIDFCLEYGILRLTTKKDLSAIHSTIASKNMKARSPTKTNNNNNTLSFEGFQEALIDIANIIYGSQLFLAHYPTADSRLEKLFTKIFLLSDKLASGESTIHSVTSSFKDTFREN
jgi:hypothetical protein